MSGQEGGAQVPIKKIPSGYAWGYSETWDSEIDRVIMDTLPTVRDAFPKDRKGRHKKRYGDGE